MSSSLLFFKPKVENNDKTSRLLVNNVILQYPFSLKSNFVWLTLNCRIDSFLMYCMHSIAALRNTFRFPTVLRFPVTCGYLPGRKWLPPPVIDVREKIFPPCGLLFFSLIATWCTRLKTWSAERKRTQQVWSMSVGGLTALPPNTFENMWRPSVRLLALLCSPHI